MNDAYHVLLNYGPLGAAFCFFVGFLWWHIRNSARVLDRKDAELRDVNERRVETAAEAVGAIQVLSDQVKELLFLVRRMEGGSRENPPSD